MWRNFASNKNVFLQAGLVAVIGLLLALVANALSPRGLRLTRNYFPAPVTDAATTPARFERPGDNAAAQRLAQRGLQPIPDDEVLGLFEDIRYEQGLVVFVDARNDQHYQAGHIPGAWQFDHYRMENYLDDVLPACLDAQAVVVYCGGGECEDSEFAAMILRDAGVPQENLFVYIGGIAEWRNNQRPIETGARGQPGNFE